MVHPRPSLESTSKYGIGHGGPAGVSDTLLVTPLTLVPPLPLRRQAEITDGWLQERLTTLLPGLMDRAGIDLWIVVAREYNEDPVLFSLTPATMLSARRRTLLVFHRTDTGVECLTVAPPWARVGPAYRTVWHDGGTQWDALRRAVDERRPARIGLDTSTDFALADGLSATEHDQVMTALGDHGARVVSAQALAIGWLETRLPDEITAAHDLNRLAHQIIAEAFSPAVVTPGVTTAEDVAWWIRQRFADLGTPAWFQPTVAAQRHGRPTAFVGASKGSGVAPDEPVEPGDLLHCDVGLASLGLHTDTQRNAYLLRPGESAPPAGLTEALRVGNRMQDLTVAQFAAGRTGNEMLLAARAAAAAEGIDGDIYSHPIGVHGHAAGPVLGMWDQQNGVSGSGDYPLYVDTMYALELCVRVDVPEWGGQQVRMALEQGIAFTGGAVTYLDDRQTELILI